MNVSRQEIIRAFLSILPSDAVLHEAEDLRPYECDGLSAYRKLPMIAVLPDSIEQVQAILKYCYQHDIPVVARGAGTGLSGGALPLEDGVLLSLAKFKNILDIDAEARLARVQPGVRNLAHARPDRTKAAGGARQERRSEHDQARRPTRSRPIRHRVLPRLSQHPRWGGAGHPDTGWPLGPFGGF